MLGNAALVGGEVNDVIYVFVKFVAEFVAEFIGIITVIETSQTWAEIRTQSNCR